MAQARGRAGRRFEAFLGVVGVLALTVTYALITGWNPVPGIADWFDRLSDVSEPGPAWNLRLSGTPTQALVAGSAVIVIREGYVESRDIGTGDENWYKHARWGAAAGSPDTGAGVVAVVGQAKGFEVDDARTGIALWHGETAASAVWTYTNLLVSLVCGGSTCTVTGHDVDTGATRWTVGLPGGARDLGGANPGLRGVRDFASPMSDQIGIWPRPAPPLLAIPAGDRIEVVDSDTGVRMREVSAPDRETRITVVGQQVLYVKAVHTGSACRYAVDARDPANGAVIWHRDGYDLGTVTGIGCEQSRGPVGVGDLIRVTTNTNQDILISVGDASVRYTAPSGKKITATDGTYVLLRDDESIVLTSIDSTRQIWSRRLGRQTDVALTQSAVMILDHDQWRFVALSPGTGIEMISVVTRGELLGFGPSGVVLRQGRTIGYLPYGRT